MLLLLIQASVSGGLFIALVWILCRVVPRLPASTRRWLWWIACTQLLARLVFGLSVPLPTPPAPCAAVAGPALTASFSSMRDVRPRANETAKREVQQSRMVDVAAHPRLDITGGLEVVLMTLWLAGVATGTVAAVRGMAKARRLATGATPVTGERIDRIYADISGSDRQRPALLQSDAATCPMLCGWPGPAIIVPTGFVDACTNAEIRMALTHELLHWRRRDQWLALGPAACQILFFFHPLARLACREAEVAREAACDIEVLLISGQSPRSYANLLLRSAQGMAPIAALGIASDYRHLHRRITMLKSPYRNKRALSGKTCLSVVILATVIALPWRVVAQIQADPSRPIDKVRHGTEPGKNHLFHAVRGRADKQAVSPKPSRHATAAAPAGHKTASTDRGARLNGTGRHGPIASAALTPHTLRMAMLPDRVQDPTSETVVPRNPADPTRPPEPTHPVPDMVLGSAKPDYAPPAEQGQIQFIVAHRKGGGSVSLVPTAAYHPKEYTIGFQMGSRALDDYTEVISITPNDRIGTSTGLASLGQPGNSNSGADRAQIKICLIYQKGGLRAELIPTEEFHPKSYSISSRLDSSGPENYTEIASITTSERFPFLSGPALSSGRH